MSSLNLGGNLLTLVPVGTFLNMASLTELILSVNSLSSMPPIPPEVAGNLVTLNLAENSIPTIPDDYFILFENLDELDLSRNSLTQLGEFSLTGLARLTSLVLTSNNLAFIHRDVFKDTTMLQTFSASGPSTADFPCFAPYIRGSLTTVELHDWKIGEVQAECVQGLTGEYITLSLVHLSIPHTSTVVMSAVCPCEIRISSQICFILWAISAI